jgi:hypothetical protein
MEFELPENKNAVKVGKFSMADLLGGSVLPQPHATIETSLYEQLGRREMEIFKLEFRDKQSIVVRGFAINGYELNGLLHFAAPSKAYGFDKADIEMDWTNLYSDDVEQQSRLERHKNSYTDPKSWQMYEGVKDLVLPLISKQRQSWSVFPMVSLLIQSKDKISWNIGSQLNVNGYIPSLGPLLIAAFAPDVTAGWEHRYKGQNMGATQVLPLVIQKRDSLIASKLVNNILELCS